MMSQAELSALNTLFYSQLDSPEGRSKMAQIAGTYTRDRLREDAYSRKIVPPENLTPDDRKIQVSMTSDTLYVVDEIEPNSKAMTMTFRGDPRAEFITAPRCASSFFTISSLKFEKFEQELLAYRMPITKIIEDNGPKDLQEIEDREWTIHVEAAVQAGQADANSVAVAPALNRTSIAAGTVIEAHVRKGLLARASLVDNGIVWPLQQPDIIDLCKMLDTNYLRAEQILIGEGDFDDVSRWTVEDFGDRVKSETTVDGYKYSTLVGRKYIRTIKTRILRPGNIYVFTSVDFLGHFYILNNTKFYIDKVANKISWQCWEDIAMNIINIAAVRKLELYSGDATVNDTDGILANVTPMAEESIGPVNNRVEQGLVFPQVTIY